MDSRPPKALVSSGRAHARTTNQKVTQVVSAINGRSDGNPEESIGDRLIVQPDGFLAITLGMTMPLLESF